MGACTVVKKAFLFYIFIYGFDYKTVNQSGPLIEDFLLIKVYEQRNGSWHLRSVQVHAVW